MVRAISIETAAPAPLAFPKPRVYTPASRHEGYPGKTVEITGGGCVAFAPSAGRYLTGETRQKCYEEQLPPHTPDDSSAIERFSPTDSVILFYRERGKRTVTSPILD